MTAERKGQPNLKKRRITLEDGRYMIFYTFEDEPESRPDNAEGKRSEPEPKPEEGGHGV